LLVALSFCWGLSWTAMRVALDEVSPAQNDEQRQILRLIFARQGLGRPFLGPPGIPPDRLDALRRAFEATMKDSEFLAEANKLKLEVNPLTGAQVEDLVKQVYGETPPAVAKRAASLLP
jgi:hypothetical protein